MATIQSNGLQFDCNVTGDASAPPLLLIMGLGMPAALWPDEFVAALAAEGFRVITFDNRDCGRSTRLGHLPVPNVMRAIVRALLRRQVTAPYTLDDMAQDTIGLLDALGVGRAHLVGASMGGMIAQVLAAKHPQRVLSLTSIMSNSGNPARRYAFGRWKALRAIVRPPPPPDDHEAVLAHLLRIFAAIGRPDFRDDLPAVRPILERVARLGLYRMGMERQLLAILATGDRRPLLQQITAPTLVLHGADDPLVPLAAGRDTAAHVRGALLEVIEDMGHDFPPSHVQRVARRIVQHCGAAPPPLVAEQAPPQSAANEPPASAAAAPATPAPAPAA